MKWSISPGLPGVFGARFVLKFWFPMQQPGTNSSSGNASSEGSSDALPVRYLLLPNGSMDSNTTSIAFDPAVGSFLVQPIGAAQAIVYVAQPTRTDNINQQQDYSFNNTPVVGTANATTTGSSNSSNSTSRAIIRHAVQPNSQMPAFLDNELAWGSPPTSRQVCTAGAAVSPVLWLLLLCCFCLVNTRLCHACGVLIQRRCWLPASPSVFWLLAAGDDQCFQPSRQQRQRQQGLQQQLASRQLLHMERAEPRTVMRHRCHILLPGQLQPGRHPTGLEAAASG
jgi:hypothetical protein